ncbi:MAG: long-chain fatty acid--CoA ligase [Spirochaetes bacterium]|nr:long-chain fatty acid--CoA ligase [Spirochaetota bacterium]
MVDIKSLINKLDLNTDSIVGIELNTYRKLWDRPTFYVKEKDGYPTRNFVSVKAGEFIEEQMHIAAGLLELGVGKGEFVALYSPNSLRHAIEIFAILSIGAIYVPLYPSLTSDMVWEVINHCEPRLLIVGGLAQFQRALPLLDRIKSPLKKIIMNTPISHQHPNVVTYEMLLHMGQQSKRYDEVIKRIQNTKKDDIAALVYTAGTMGIPKGAMLSHGNFIAQIPLAELFHITANDVRHSHLPFSHVYGLSCDLFASALIGSKIAITSSFDVEEIVNDIEEVRPTIMCSVPRMYEKLYIHILRTIENFGKIKKLCYTFALNVGKEYFMMRTIGKKANVFLIIAKMCCALIYRRIRKMIYMDRMRILFSGGAPLSVEIAYFFGGIGLEILEGYGLTETSPVINVNLPGKSRPGTVGPPLKNVDEVISDEGEILVKGPMVFKGYYRYEGEDASDCFTSEGYFRTGDLGVFNANGYLTITGRVKDIIITSGGKNISPQSIESKFTADEYIRSFCVIGDRRKYLTALVVPNFEKLRAYAWENNIVFQDHEDLIKKQEIVDFYKKRIEDVSNSLARYEQIKKFTLLPKEFSFEEGELTHTNKFRRDVINKKYKHIIDAMYPESSLII